MQHQTLDYLIPLSLLLLPALCLPIPPQDLTHDWELVRLPSGQKASCHGSSLLSSIELRPTDENDIAGLILAHDAGRLAETLSIVDEDYSSQNLEHEDKPRSSLRKRTQRPPIAPQHQGQDQLRSKSTNDASSTQRSTTSPPRSWSASNLQSPMHFVSEPAETNDELQDRIDYEVAENCGFFDDLLNEFYNITGDRVSHRDFGHCVELIKKHVKAAASATGVKSGMADVARTMRNVAEAAGKFRETAGSKQKGTSAS